MLNMNDNRKQDSETKHASGLRLIRGGQDQRPDRDPSLGASIASDKMKSAGNGQAAEKKQPINPFVAQMNAFADALDAQIRVILEK